MFVGWYTSCIQTGYWGSWFQIESHIGTDNRLDGVVGGRLKVSVQWCGKCCLGLVRELMKGVERTRTIPNKRLIVIVVAQSSPPPPPLKEQTLLRRHLVSGVVVLLILLVWFVVVFLLGALSALYVSRWKVSESKRARMGKGIGNQERQCKKTELNQQPSR